MIMRAWTWKNSVIEVGFKSGCAAGIANYLLGVYIQKKRKKIWGCFIRSFWGFSQLGFHWSFGVIGKGVLYSKKRKKIWGCFIRSLFWVFLGSVFVLLDLVIV